MHRHASLLILAGLMTASLHAQTAPPAPPSPTPAVATPSQRTPPPARVATTPPLAPTQVPPPARAAQTAPPSKPRPGSDVPPPVYPQGAPPSAPRPGTAQPTTPPSPAAAPRRSDDEILRMPTQNVRLDLTITDAPGAGASARKVVTMLVADGRMGRIRSSNKVQVSEGAPNNMFSRQILINIDATPIVRPDGRILLSLTVEYVPDVAQGASKPASVNESLTVIVGDGKSTLISQSADPATDRRVTVEVLATVVR
jgi:hypothetical protein